MARKPRIVGDELYHHVYAWGNDRHPVFKKRSDYLKYLDFAGEYSKRYDVDLIAYALIWWHIHLFVFDLLGNLPRFMNSLHGRYAQYVNKTADRVGHVFGERYNNKVVEGNEYGLWLTRYIHRQPIELGLVENPSDYEWTSHRAYMGLAPRNSLKPDVILGQFGKAKRGAQVFEEFVMGTEDGPIDWDGADSPIIGSDDFKEEVRSRIRRRMRDDASAVDLAELASQRLGVEQSVLSAPKGIEERRIRHSAFAVLVNEYGLTLAEVARRFGVSPTAVMKAVKK